MSGKSQNYLTVDELKNSLCKSAKSLTLVKSPRPIKLAAFIILFGFFLLAMLLVFAPWVQTVEGVGRVIAYAPNQRQQFLEAPVDGKIDTWHVREGQTVKKGDPIVDISDIDPDILERLKRESDALKAKLNAAQKSLETSLINVERQKSLWNKGLSSKRAYELAELEYQKFQSEVSSTTAEVTRLETRIARQASQIVMAPTDGFVQRIIAFQGGVLVKQGDSLALIVPESSDRAVELTVSGNDIPLISIGREVRLQFEGWPAVQFAGWPSVAVGTFSGKIGVIDPSDDGTGRFRIVVFPIDSQSWPEPKYLRQGVKVIGWVLLDTVRLGWEFWRRFNAFPLNAPRGDVEKTVKK